MARQEACRLQHFCACGCYRTSRRRCAVVARRSIGMGSGQLGGVGRAGGTGEQNPDLQLDALTTADCTPVFSDTASGALDKRPQFDALLDYVRPGDALVVWRLDRLGRFSRHLTKTSPPGSPPSWPSHSCSGVQQLPGGRQGRLRRDSHHPRRLDPDLHYVVYRTCPCARAGWLRVAGAAQPHLDRHIPPVPQITAVRVHEKVPQPAALPGHPKQGVHDLEIRPP
jgi:hypothetical protein